MEEDFVKSERVELEGAEEAQARAAQARLEKVVRKLQSRLAAGVPPQSVASAALAAADGANLEPSLLWV